MSEDKKPVESQVEQAATKAPEQVQGTNEETTDRAATGSQEDAAAKAAVSAVMAQPQRDMVASLPLLLSLTALILAAAAFYMMQQGGGEQNARLQSLAVRMNAIEVQANDLEHRLEVRETQSNAQEQAIIHSELELIAAKLSRIAPLATGEEKATIDGIQQLLSHDVTGEDNTPVLHGTVEAIPLNQ